MFSPLFKETLHFSLPSLFFTLCHHQTTNLFTTSIKTPKRHKRLPCTCKTTSQLFLNRKPKHHINIHLFLRLSHHGFLPLYPLLVNVTRKDYIFFPTNFIMPPYTQSTTYDAISDSTTSVSIITSTFLEANTSVGVNII